ncbi:MAG: hypothetical protein AVDCRST_MAG67-255, partial [uncultured Solirubrobacteraceae bacterium]
WIQQRTSSPFRFASFSPRCCSACCSCSRSISCSTTRASPRRGRCFTSSCTTGATCSACPVT